MAALTRTLTLNCFTNCYKQRHNIGIALNFSIADRLWLTSRHRVYDASSSGMRSTIAELTIW